MDYYRDYYRDYYDVCGRCFTFLCTSGRNRGRCLMLVRRKCKRFGFNDPERPSTPAQWYLPKAILCSLRSPFSPLTSAHSIRFIRERKNAVKERNEETNVE